MIDFFLREVTSEKRIENGSVDSRMRCIIYFCHIFLFSSYSDQNGFDDHGYTGCR